MLPDTLEGSIHRLTQNILADYTAGRPIDRIEPFNQPDRDVIIALIGKLRRIVFPGYFRDPAYHVYSAAHSLSALIEDTAYLLQKQIAIALRCGSSVTQEAAADIDRQARPTCRPSTTATRRRQVWTKSLLPIRGCSPSRSTAWRTSCFCSKCR